MPLMSEFNVGHWYELNYIEEMNVARKDHDLRKMPHLVDLAESGLVKTDFPYSFKVLLTDYGWQVVHAWRRHITEHYGDIREFIPPERLTS